MGGMVMRLARHRDRRPHAGEPAMAAGYLDRIDASTRSAAA
jgi:hypothetical protein